ncbi:unnamed protein product [Peronospora belbahrii]|nr:unnamed protein product [Peronospora belbahrii]
MSENEDGNPKGCAHLVVYFAPKSNQKRKRSQSHVYLRFVLQKTNLEHFAAIDKLARRLRRPVSAFSYAGTKDKTAITFQHIVVSGIESDRLLSINTSAGDTTTAIRVGNLKYVESPMSLGEASGNRFTIVVRYLSAEPQSTYKIFRSTLESALSDVERQGFIYYFGFQRVGLPTSTVRPYHIGKMMIACKWEEALRLILQVKQTDSEAAVRAKRLYLESGDVEDALKHMPRGMSIERQVLQRLKRHGSGAFEQAIRTVAHSRRVMYMHAYQSFLFIGWHCFGCAITETYMVVVGDLIQCNTQSVRTGYPTAGWHKRCFTSNATKDACIKIMEQDGTKEALIESGPLKGAYRSLIAYPCHLDWTWQEDHDESLSLQLSFSLNTGCFATMCLRELLHSDI